jgi:hypothetical protein
MIATSDHMEKTYCCHDHSRSGNHRSCSCSNRLGDRLCDSLRDNFNALRSRGKLSVGMGAKFRLDSGFVQLCFRKQMGAG